jgi:hypothetical protein
MSHRMPEPIEKNSDAVIVVIGLGKVAFCPPRKMLGTESAQIAMVEPSEVLQSSEASSQCRKVGVCNSLPTCCRNWRKADPYVLIESVDSAPNEALGELRHVGWGATMRRYTHNDYREPNARKPIAIAVC